MIQRVKENTLTTLMKRRILITVLKIQIKQMIPTKNQIKKAKTEKNLMKSQNRKSLKIRRAEIPKVTTRKKTI